MFTRLKDVLVYLFWLALALLRDPLGVWEAQVLSPAGDFYWREFVPRWPKAPYLRRKFDHCMARWDGR